MDTIFVGGFARGWTADGSAGIKYERLREIRSGVDFKAVRSRAYHF